MINPEGCFCLKQTHWNAVEIRQRHKAACPKTQHRPDA